MSGRPPREGARWGDDPEPKIKDVEEEAYDHFALIREKYGDDFIKSAYALRSKLKGDFPNLEINRVSDEDAVTMAMKIAIQTMAFLEEDDRPHSMPEIYSVMFEQLGPNLARQPQVTRVEDLKYLKLTFGDEEKGRYLRDAEAQDRHAAVAVREREKSTSFFIKAAVAFVVLWLLFGMVSG
ncbi:hypothetical protein DXV76_21050 [Rhodobacteraceae bacterium CCMM004]|nr:hypothetical protein DXV76_21050 [Rhodobacteraceae bacterium CCMM004]